MIANEFTGVGLGTVYYKGTTQYGYESITAGEFTNASDYTDKYPEDAGNTENPGNTGNSGNTQNPGNTENEDGIHDIFTAKDTSKLEIFKARILNRLLYHDEAIDVSDIDISEGEIVYTTGKNNLTGIYAVRQIVRDNPLHSTISTRGFPEFTYKANGNVETVKFTYHPVWTKAFVKQVLAGYDDAMSLIKEGDSDFAKILKLHDWIVKNVAYGMSANTADFAVGALANKRAVCAGYAQCYQFLLSQTGVDSIYIAANTKKEPHAWNLVKYEGHWFHVDCTWDRGVGPNPTVKHDYFMKSDDEFNEDGAHTEDWKAPEKNYPQGNDCTIINKFYAGNKDIAQDEQIKAHPIKIKHEYDTSQPYHTSKTEHWRVCKAGVEIREQHDGNPCSICHYEQKTECDHKWSVKKDAQKHWEECEVCHEKRNEESHSWAQKKDAQKHWEECEVCHEKRNEESHSWAQKKDAAGHWKECEGCGYTTDKEAHTGNPCSECNYSSSSGGSDKDDTDKPGGPDKDDTDKPSDYKLVTKIHVSGTDKASVITCARSFDKFVDILVDGAEVPKQLYTARSGSTIVEISADYLNTLNVGTHTVTFRYTDGNVTGNFEVVAKADDQDKTSKTDDKTNASDKKNKTDNKTTASAKTEGKATNAVRTGDKMNAHPYILLLSGSVLILFALVRHRRKKTDA
ncbi:MAG: transglutaminase domain-containing protein [Dorea sp.]|nr:transglutaminase domain-containing protein [Dorea sp.]